MVDPLELTPKKSPYFFWIDLIDHVTIITMAIKTDLSNTTAPQDGLRFWSGHILNCQRVMDFTGLKVDDIARIAGVPKASVRFDHQMPVEIEECMKVIASTCNTVFGFFNSEVKTNLWLLTPNPMLGYVTPRNMILAGRQTKLLKFVADALED